MSVPAVNVPRSLDAFVTLAGARVWRSRLNEIRDLAAAGPRAGQAIRERHAVELAIERLRNPGERGPASAETELVGLAAQAVALAATLSPPGRQRLRETIRAGLSGEKTLIPLFHLLRTAALHRSRGFKVRFAGLEDAAAFDLLLQGEGVDAEVACEVVSAEDGRGVHRGAWFRLADRVDPDLQIWLGAHPGRYLLKMTLAQGLQGGLSDAPIESDPLAQLHQRIRALLASHTRHDHDEAVVLRLDPLLLTAAQADDLGLVSSLRRQFGPEAHLSVTTAGGGVFVMAARAGQENAIAVAFRKRMAAIAPVRLSGTRPGILAMFVEDTNRGEWRGLRERLELEGEARQFLTNPEARPVVAVTFASRLELFGLKGPDAAPDGELRFRNPGHPAARAPGLASAVLSSV
jgi:hypothetical protein